VLLPGYAIRRSTIYFPGGKQLHRNRPGSRGCHLRPFRHFWPWRLLAVAAHKTHTTQRLRFTAQVSRSLAARGRLSMTVKSARRGAARHHTTWHEWQLDETRDKSWVDRNLDRSATPCPCAITGMTIARMTNH